MLTCKANTTRLNTITPQSIITVWRIETLHTLVVGRVAQWCRDVHTVIVSGTFSACCVHTIEVGCCHAIIIINTVETEIVAADLMCCQQTNISSALTNVPVCQGSLHLSNMQHR